MEYEIQVCLELRGVLFRSQAEDGIRDSSVTGVQTYAVFFLRSEEHTSELQSHLNLVCRLLLEKKKGQGRRTVSVEPDKHSCDACSRVASGEHTMTAQDVPG